MYSRSSVQPNLDKVPTTITDTQQSEGTLYEDVPLTSCLSPVTHFVCKFMIIFFCEQDKIKLLC